MSDILNEPCTHVPKGESCLTCALTRYLVITCRRVLHEMLARPRP